MMKKKIVVIGSEGTARNIIEQISDAIHNHGYQAELAGIVIDTYKKGSLVAGIPVLGGTKETDTIKADKSLSFIFALFKPEKMTERLDLLMSLNIPVDSYINFIHPLSYVAESATVGKGNVVMSNSNVQSNVILGDFNIINTGVTIEHETVLGNGNFLAANSCLGSKVKIGCSCFIGINSSVRENVCLGDNVFVGMHSMVIEEFSDCRIRGIPARTF